MTPAQRATLKAAIIADATANAFPNTSDGNFSCAEYLNAVPGSPTAIWKQNIPVADVIASITMSEFAVLTAIKQNGLLLLTQSSVDATKATVRAAFSSIFAAGASLTALTALAQRPGTRFEVIFSAGGPPAVSTMYGQAATASGVQEARDS